MKGTYKMAQVKSTNKKMSKGSLIAVIVSIVLLACFALALLSSNGVFVRIQTAASTDDMSINGAMASYFTYYYYQNWVNSDESYYHKAFGWFSTEKAWDEQKLISDSSKTYADYFAEGGKALAERYLILCQAAKNAGVYKELEKEAKKVVDEYIDGYVSILAQLYGYTLPSYLKLQYGENISESDYNKCLVLEHIASSYLEDVHEELYDKIDGNNDRIKKYFDEHLSELVTAEILTFSVSQPKSPVFPKADDYKDGKDSAAYKKAAEAASKDKTLTPPVPEDYVGGENAPAYKKAYEEAEKLKKENDLEKVAHEQLMKKLESATSEEEFKKYVLEYKYNDAFNTAYNSATNKFTADEKPSEGDLNTYRESVKNDIINAVLDEKTSLELETPAESASKWEKAKASLTTSVITSLTSTINSCVKVQGHFLTSDLGNKLFGGVKDQYGIPYVEDEVKGTNAVVGDKWYAETAIKGLEDKVADIEKEIADKKESLKAEGADTAKINEEIKTLETSLETAKTNLSDAQKAGKYTFAAYYVTEAAHRNEDKVRDVGHILFKVDTTLKADSTSAYATWAKAEEKANELLATIKAEYEAGTLTKEKFEEHGKVTHDGNVFYEDVATGDMVEEFEDWLFKAGKVGEVGLVKTEYGYHIMYYMGEKDITGWERDAHNGAASEDLDTWYENLGIKVNFQNADLFNPYN